MFVGWNRPPGKSEEGHDDAGCTESALTAVEVDHRLLDRMKPAIRGAEVLNRDKLPPVEHGKEEQAGVDGVVPEAFAVALCQDNRAGAAVPLSASLFDSPVCRERPEVMQNGCSRCQPGAGAEVEIDHTSVKDEGDGIQIFAL